MASNAPGTGNPIVDAVLGRLNALIATMDSFTKGDTVFQRTNIVAAQNLRDVEPFDMSRYNALAVHVTGPTGSPAPTVDIKIYESDSKGGVYLLIPDTSGNTGGSNGLWPGLADGSALVASIGKPWARILVVNLANFIGVSSPSTAPTLVGSGIGGTIPAGAYSYEISYLGTFGESLTGPATLTVTLTGTTSSVALSAIPIGPTGTTARKIYRSSGTGYGYTHTIADNTTTTYTDTGDTASTMPPTRQPSAPGWKVLANGFTPSNRTTTNISNTANQNLTEINSGTVAAGNPLPVGGSPDGTTTKVLLTDSSGRAEIAAADGQIVTIGAEADVAVTGDNPGTISAKLRGLTKILADAWNTTRHALTTIGAKGSKSTVTQVTLTVLAAPSAPTLATATTGGTIAAGTYQAEITYTNSNGETVASTSTSQVTTGTTSTMTVNSPPALGNATGWYAYVTQAGGATYTRQQTAGSPTAIGTNLILTAPPTSSGLAPPSANTAGTPTLLLAANAARIGMALRNLDFSLLVYLGNSNVQISGANGGTPLGAGTSPNPGDPFDDDLTTDAWYGVASGAPIVSVMEVS